MEPPRDRDMTLQGLLRFAMEHTKSEDAPNSTQWAEMGNERKEFLEKVLKSMTVDIMEEFEQAINVLDNDSSPVPDKLQALSTIREYIDNLDFANSFLKIGGAKYLLTLLKSEDIQLRVNATYIVAEMSQMNPFSQEHFLAADVLPLLISYFNESEDVANSALHAVSALIRSFEPGLVKFLELGGIKTLLDCLNTQHSRVFIKACFLIASLSMEQSSVRDEFVKKGAANKLFSQLELVSDFDIKTETTLFALSSLSKSPDWKKSEISADAVELIKQLIEVNKNLPQCAEIVEYSRTILEAL